VQRQVARMPPAVLKLFCQ